jgi:hypothetical protein
MEGAGAAVPKLSPDFCITIYAHLGGGIVFKHEVWMHIEIAFASQSLAWLSPLPKGNISDAHAGPCAHMHIPDLSHPSTNQ